MRPSHVLDHDHVHEEPPSTHIDLTPWIQGILWVIIAIVLGSAVVAYLRLP